jgi:hypothetical protein
MGVTSYLSVDGEILSETRSGVERDYLPNPLGSVVALLDSTQTKTDTWTFWPYGEITARTGSSGTPFTFVGAYGYYGSSNSQLSYVRMRFLNRSILIWLTKDFLWPMEKSLANDWSNPVSKADPSGNSPGNQVYGSGLPAACVAALANCLQNADNVQNACNRAATDQQARDINACNAFTGIAYTQCITNAGSKYLKAVIACRVLADPLFAKCGADFEACKKRSTRPRPADPYQCYPILLPSPRTCATVAGAGTFVLVCDWLAPLLPYAPILFGL